ARVIGFVEGDAVLLPEAFQQVDAVRHVCPSSCSFPSHFDPELLDSSRLTSLPRLLNSSSTTPLSQPGETMNTYRTQQDMPVPKRRTWTLKILLAAGLVALALVGAFPPFRPAPGRPWMNWSDHWIGRMPPTSAAVIDWPTYLIRMGLVVCLTGAA